MRKTPMLSAMPLRPLCAVALLTATTLLAGCGDKVVSTPPAACSALIPQSWRTPVPAEPIPQTDGLPLLEQVKAWAAAFVGQTGALEKQAGRTEDAIGVFERCEALVNRSRRLN